MEESKELQGLYTLFRVAIYVSLVLEFFMYALDPSALDFWEVSLQTFILVFTKCQYISICLSVNW